jgi:predicted transglutaminase-like cysteine proteinase
VNLKPFFLTLVTSSHVLVGSAFGSEYALPPFQHTMFCLRYPAECVASPQASSLLAGPAMIRQLQKINSTVNKAILPISLPPSPLNQWTIFPYAGLCGDYAVTKRHLLQSSGWPSSDLLLAEVIVRRTGEHHLILIVRTPNESWVLDNLSANITPIKITARSYSFLRIASSDEPLYWKRAPAEIKRL